MGSIIWEYGIVDEPLFLDSSKVNFPIRPYLGWLTIKICCCLLNIVCLETRGEGIWRNITLAKGRWHSELRTWAVYPLEGYLWLLENNQQEFMCLLTKKTQHLQGHLIIQAEKSNFFSKQEEWVLFQFLRGELLSSANQWLEVKRWKGYLFLLPTHHLPPDPPGCPWAPFPSLTPTLWALLQVLLSSQRMGKWKQKPVAHGLENFRVIGVQTW